MLILTSPNRFKNGIDIFLIGVIVMNVCLVHSVQVVGKMATRDSRL